MGGGQCVPKCNLTLYTVNIIENISLFAHSACEHCCALVQIKLPGELDGYNLGPFGPNVNTVTLVSKLFTTFGAVPVSGKNMFQLLKRGEHVLLYPGGIREVIYVWWIHGSCNGNLL